MSCICSEKQTVWLFRATINYCSLTRCPTLIIIPAKTASLTHNHTWPFYISEFSFCARSLFITGEHTNTFASVFLREELIFSLSGFQEASITANVQHLSTRCTSAQYLVSGESLSKGYAIDGITVCTNEEHEIFPSTCPAWSHIYTESGTFRNNIYFKTAIIPHFWGWNSLLGCLSWFNMFQEPRHILCFIMPSSWMCIISLLQSVYMVTMMVLFLKSFINAWKWIFSKHSWSQNY